MIKYDLKLNDIQSATLEYLATKYGAKKIDIFLYALVLFDLLESKSENGEIRFSISGENFVFDLNNLKSRIK